MNLIFPMANIDLYYRHCHFSPRTLEKFQYEPGKKMLKDEIFRNDSWIYVLSQKPKSLQKSPFWLFL